LGIIIYNLAFKSKSFSKISYGMADLNFNQIKKGNLFSEEMINNRSPHFIQLLKMLLKINPKERASASEVISFLEKNIYNNINSNSNTNSNSNNNNIINNQAKDDLLHFNIKLNNSNTNYPYTYNSNINKNNNDLLNTKITKSSFTKKISDATAKLFKRHSTQFWILKLTNVDLEYPPKFKYIKNLVIKSWKKRNKIIKVFTNLSKRPLYYISSVAIKSLYVLHHYLFLSPKESLLLKEFNLDEFIFSIINLWTIRLTNENYDSEDVLSNPLLSKFIISYAEFLRSKILFHKKYPFIENNFSLDYFIKSKINTDNYNSNNSNNTNKDTNFSILIDKKFINDLLSYFSFSFQKIVQIPINLKYFTNIINLIINIFNEELISIHFLLFYVIIAYKKYNYNSSNKTENSIKAFDSLFIETSLKVQELFESFRKYRNEIKSTNLALGSFASAFELNLASEELSNLPIDFTIEYLKNLNSKFNFFPIENFNLRNFFCNEILNWNDVCLNSSIGILIENNQFDKDYFSIKKKLDLGSAQYKTKKEFNNNNINNCKKNKINIIYL
jgi:hypothetical protein